jgi:hypothetical protein
MLIAQRKPTLEHPARLPAFEVWRRDDNGNEFLVATFGDQASAERKIAELSAGGHKQTYWVREFSG